MFSFFTRWPGWAVGVVIVLAVVGSVGYGFYSLTRPRLAVTTSAQHCVNQPSRLASLFSDGETTMIRLSNADYTDMQVLRTEPANVLPGMFQAMLSLSADNSRLAYVTASDELLDNAHLEYIKVTDPANPVDLTTVPNGFWTVQPAWSGDGKKLAFVTLDQSGGAPGQFELMVADTSTQPVTVGVEADLVTDNFTNGQSATLCWTPENRVVLVPSNPVALPSPSPTTAAASPTASPSPKTGSPCGVPIFSQNDPGWRDSVMKTGTDSIGGAGCALTSTAMLLNYYGSSLTPPQLNACLGASADPIDWKAVPACTNGLISGGDRIDFSWTDLDALLAAGRPAIVGMLRGQTGSHFVVVTQGGGGVASSYKITDPWDATTSKTLGSYIDAGYTPAWIISFTGPGHNCGRLIKGVVPALPTLQDGGATNQPVTVNPNPNLKNLKFLGILKLSGGTILKDTFNLPQPYTKINPGLTITDEGIYQILVTTQAPSQPPISQLYTFTIDKTAPAVDLAFLNPKTSGDVARSIGRGGATTAATATTAPVLNRPGQVRVTSSDTLSGVKDIKYSLDGGAQTEYTSDNTFNRVVTVDGCGDHAMRIRGFDAAGNLQDVTKTFTVYCFVAPSPSPSPSPRSSSPPPRTSPSPVPTCPTKLTGGSLSTVAAGSARYYVYWQSSGGCAPFSGTITGAQCWPDPASGQITCQPPFWTQAITTPTGARLLSPAPTFCSTASGQFVRFSLTLYDSFKQVTTAVYGDANTTPVPTCIP